MNEKFVYMAIGAVLAVLLLPGFKLLWSSFLLALSNRYCLLLFLVAQFIFQVFLIMQWIFAYDAVTRPDYVWSQFAYLPITVVIPVFFGNILLGLVVGGRLKDVGK